MTADDEAPPADDPARLEVMWCARHLEPYRAQWPKGAGVAMVKLFTAAVAMQAVIDAAHGDTSKLPEALARFSPVCCFVSAETLAEVYAESGVTP